MITAKETKAAVVLAAMLVAQGSVAERAASPEGWEGDLALSAFESAPSSSVEVLSEGMMENTRGELWPFIFTVVGFDLAISTYFWGTYVPMMNYASPGGGGCSTCGVLTIAKPL